MSIFKTAFVLASLVLSVSAANAANDVIDNYHGNTNRWSMSQNARAAFAAQPAATRQVRWAKMTPFSREDLSRGTQ